MSLRLGDAVTGIYETHLTVADLDRSLAFYCDRLGFKLWRRFPERDVAFLAMGEGGARGMLGLWGVGSGPMHMRLHFAFAASQAALLDVCRLLASAGIAPLSLSGEPVTEPVVIGWMPAMAVYFADPDGHSLEMIHRLDEPPDGDFGVGALSAWRRRRAAG